MHAISLVNKMQRLALSSASMDVDGLQRSPKSASRESSSMAMSDGSSGPPAGDEEDGVLLGNGAPHPASPAAPGACDPHDRPRASTSTSV